MVVFWHSRRESTSALVDCQLEVTAAWNMIRQNDEPTCGIVNRRIQTKRSESTICLNNAVGQREVANSESEPIAVAAVSDRRPFGVQRAPLQTLLSLNFIILINRQR